MTHSAVETTRFITRPSADSLERSYFRVSPPPPDSARGNAPRGSPGGGSLMTSSSKKPPPRSSFKVAMISKEAASEVERYHPRQNKRPVYTLFVCLVLGQVFLNYDSGAVPSVLPIIGENFKLSPTMLGLLGALPYIGLVIASPFVGTALQKYSQKTVLVITIGINCIATIMLTVSINSGLLYSSKLLMGLTQAAYFIYLPVWVDEFAPQNHITLWMGIVQGSVVFGVMIGYLITGFIRPWQYSIIVEDVALLSLCAVLLATPSKFIDLYDPPETAPLKLSELETSPTASHERKLDGVRKYSDEGDITLSTEEDRNGEATGSTAVAPPVGDGVGRVRSKLGSQGSSFDIEATDSVMRLLQSQHQRKLANYHKLRAISTSFDMPWHDIASNLPPPRPSGLIEGGVSPRQSGVPRLWSGASPSAPAPQRDGGRIGHFFSDAFPGRLTVSRGPSKGAESDVGPEGAAAAPDSSQLSSPPVTSARRTLKQVLAQRGAAIVVPSPCGAVMNSLDVAAGFDDPALIVNARGMEVRRKETAAALAAAEVARSEPVGERLPSVSEVRGAGVRTARGIKSTGFCASLKCLMRNGVYYWTVLTLCALFYVVTGLQYWATTYFISAKHISENKVRIIFSATAATAPALGVLVGAISVDYLGGYRSTRGMFRALIFTASTGLAASLCGVAASFLDPFGWIMAMIWLQMFLGGTILPAATGILIASVDPCIRPFASSFSMFLYNILGYSLGTFLPGPFMVAFGVETGMKIVFFWSFFGVIFIFMAILSAWRSEMVVTDMSCTTAEDMKRTCVV